MTNFGSDMFDGWRELVERMRISGMLYTERVRLLSPSFDLQFVITTLSGRNQKEMLPSPERSSNPSQSKCHN